MNDTRPLKRKSRTGCRRCKQRKVKCDERVPCTACTRHRVPCSLTITSIRHDRPQPPHRQDLPHVSPHAGSQSSIEVTIPRSVPLRPQPGVASSEEKASPQDGSSPAVSITSQIHRVPSPSASAAPVNSTVNRPRGSSDPDQQPNDSRSWLQNLHLIHHYSTSTCHTMPRTPELLHNWRDAIPKMAFKSSYLMYQVLAVAAFHKAHLAPSGEREQWVLKALGYHGRTTEDLRLATRELTDESCHAVFATASLLVINSFASYSCQSPGSAVEDLLDIFELARGMNGILKMYESSLWSGPLGRQFDRSKEPSESPELAEVMRELAIAASDPASVVGSDVVCSQAAESLTYAIERAMLTSSAPHLRVAFYWPIALSEEFMRLLKDRQAAAFVVLWYYSRVLSLGESRVWYLTGWGEALLRDAQRLSSNAVGSLR